MYRTNPFFSFLQPLAMAFREEPGEPAAGGGEPATPPADPAPADPAPSDKSLISGADPKPDEGNDPKPDPADPADPPKGEETPPEPIKLEDITLPEGMEFGEEEGAAFVEMLNDENLSKQELVGKMLEMHKDAVTNTVQQLTDDWNKTRSEWHTAAKALPEIGGEKFDATLASIKSGFDAAGAGQEVYDALDATGLGDNPHFIQLAHKLVQPFLEQPPKTGEAPSTPEDRAARLYPSMAKKD
jgi:hypothetical protein